MVPFTKNFSQTGVKRQQFSIVSCLVRRRRLLVSACSRRPQGACGTDRSPRGSTSGSPEGSDVPPALARLSASPTRAPQVRSRLLSCAHSALGALPKSLSASPSGRCQDVRGSPRRGKERPSFVKPPAEPVASTRGTLGGLPGEL